MKYFFKTLFFTVLLGSFYLLSEKYLFENSGTYVWFVIAITQIQLWEIKFKDKE